MPIDAVGIHPNAAFRGHIVMNEVCMNVNCRFFKMAQKWAVFATSMSPDFTGHKGFSRQKAWDNAMRNIKYSWEKNCEIKHEG